MPFKPCPKCSKPSGVRTLACPCGHVFSAGKNVAKPAGPPPILRPIRPDLPAAITPPWREEPKGNNGPPPAIPVPQAGESYVLVKVRRSVSIESFIVDLKRAADNSQYTGGLYSVFLRLDDGRTLQVEIALPTDHRDRE